MNYKIITDTHFNHDKMVEYCGRPKDFELRIEKGLKQLTGDDILIHLGDICIGKDQEIHDRYIKWLPCRKWLIRGNHDKKSNNWYLRNGWDFVADMFSIILFGKEIIFSHRPLGITGDVINIHGHFHNSLQRLLKKEWVVPDEEERNKRVLEVLTDNHKLLVLEDVDYKVVDLEKFIATYPQLK